MRPLIPDAYFVPIFREFILFYFPIVCNFQVLYAKITFNKYILIFWMHLSLLTHRFQLLIIEGTDRQSAVHVVHPFSSGHKMVNTNSTSQAKLSENIFQSTKTFGLENSMYQSMIFQIISPFLVVHKYFLSLCRYVILQA